MSGITDVGVLTHACHPDCPFPQAPIAYPSKSTYKCSQDTLVQITNEPLVQQPFSGPKLNSLNHECIWPSLATFSLSNLMAFLCFFFCWILPKESTGTFCFYCKIMSSSHWPWSSSLAPLQFWWPTPYRGWPAIKPCPWFYYCWLKTEILQLSRVVLE